MAFSQRLWPATRAALKHLAASLVVALLCAGLVFGLWYPEPLGALSGGRGLFLLMISVDVVCGPLLTSIVFNPKKPRKELWRDIGFVVLLQLAALTYGLQSTMQARPVFIAFEGDRFRVVSLPDIDGIDISNAPADLREFGFSGPRLVGVKLLKAGDPDYLKSLEAAINGMHPAFRPSRWVPYDQQRSDILASVKPLSVLRQKNSENAQVLEDFIQKSGISEQKLAYLPLVAGAHTDWVGIVNLDDTKPIAYLHLDGW